MKKYYYLIFESIIIALIIVLIIVVNILVQSVFCYVFSIMAIIYFSSIILRSVKLLFDITQGVKEKYTIFLGNHGSEKLDVFSKITFTSI